MVTWLAQTEMSAGLVECRWIDHPNCIQGDSLTKLSTGWLVLAEISMG